MQHNRKFYIVLSLLLLVSNLLIASSIKDLNYRADTGREIPLKNIKLIALDEGQDLWGDVVIDDLIPICDLNGNIYSYNVTLKLNSKYFPDEIQIYNNIESIKNKLKASKNNLSKNELEELRKQRWGIDKYRTFMIAGRYDVGTIKEFYKGLPHYYTKLYDAKKIASKYLNPKSLKLTRIFYNGFVEKWFEFSDNNQNIYINTYSLKVSTDLDKFHTKENLLINLDEKKKIWEYRLNQVDIDDAMPSTKGTQTASINGVPFYDQRYNSFNDGCSPTAAAMVLGYWDNNGYPNLIDGNHNYYNPPVQLIQHLADAMGTNENGSGTNPFYIDEGIEDVTSSLGYNFSSNESSPGGYSPIGTINSHWHYIKSKIDGDNPLVWSVGGYDAPNHGGGEIEHSVTIVGYKKRTESKWYWLHTAWWCYAYVHDGWHNQPYYWLIMKRDELTGTFYSPDAYTDLCTRVTPPGIDPPPPPPLTVDIGGPASLQYGETATYFASTYGGSETVINYKWWKRNDEGVIEKNGSKAPPAGQWFYLDHWEGEPEITSASSFDFSLKCKVFDSEGGTDTDIISVTIDESKKLSKKGIIQQKFLSSIPEKIVINENYPNPFNPTTSIRFGLPKINKVEIAIYSLTGQKIKTLTNKKYNSGYHTVNWNGTDSFGNKVSSGIYIYKMITGSKVLSKKMVLTK